MPHFNSRYAIVRTLGENPAGGVFLVEDSLHGNARIALKTIRPAGIDAAHLNALRNEFFTLSRFKHPNIAQVFDFGTVHTTDMPGYEGCFYFTLEYIEGKDLFTFTDGASADRLRELVFQLAHALAYIHRHGLIHFDLKPSNIIVADAVRGGHAAPLVKIIDFGFASSTIASLGQPIRGTLGYIAPELLRGDAYDERADLYSLGATLYEIAARKAPFSGRSATELIKRHLSSAVPSVQSKRPDVSREMAALIAELLEKDPARRPCSAASVAERMRGTSPHDIQHHEMLIRIPVHTMAGREKEAERLCRFLNEALDDHKPEEGSPACFVSGETGIGKSSLLHEVRRRMQAQGMTVFHTQCFARSSEPYEPFIKLLRDQIAHARSFGTRGEDFVQRHSQAAAAACGAHADAIARQTNDPESRLHFADRCADLFFELASFSPYAVVIDDIDNADESSLELFQYVLRSLRGHRIGFLVSGISASAVLPSSAAPSEPLAEVVRLDPLDEAGVRELMGSFLGLPDVPAALARSVVQRIGGSPYIVREFLSQYIGAPADTLCDAIASDVAHPIEAFAGTIVRLYEQKIAARRPEEFLLMQLISCFDAPVRRRLLAQVSPFSPQRLRQILDLLVSLGIVRSMENGMRYHFADPQFRSFVYNALGSAKASAHALIAAAMVKSEAYGPHDAEAAAHHFKRAGDDRTAYALFRTAAEHKRARSAVNESIALLNEARALLPSGESDAPLLEELAQAYSQAGDYKNAVLLYDQLRAGDGCDAKRYTYAKELGLIHNREGRLEEAIACLTEAAQRARTAVETIDVEEELAIIDMSRGRYAEAHERCMRVLDANPEAAGSVAITGILNNLGIIHFYQNRPDDSAACFRRSIAILQNEGEKSKLIGPYLNLGNVHSAQGQFAEASAYWQHALLLSQEVGNLQQEARAYNNIGIAAFNQGGTDEASLHYEKAYGIFSRLGFVPGMALCLTNIGEVHCANAEYERAIECWEKDLQLYRSLQDEHGMTEIDLQLAGVHLVFGDTEAVRRLLAEARALLGENGITTQHALFHHVQGCLGLLCGTPDAARKDLDRARELFGEAKDHRGYCLASVRLAEAEEAMENDERAFALLDEVRREAGERRFALIEGEALYRLGELQARRMDDDREPALVLYTQAFEAIQSQPVTEITWRTCFRLGSEFIRRGLHAKGRRYLTYAREALEYIGSRIATGRRRRQYFKSWGRDEALRAIEVALRGERTM